MNPDRSRADDSGALRPIDDREAGAPLDALRDLNSVCLFLGPYRNLTTLTASLLTLHPECQVLNHGSNRVLPFAELNFLVDYSDAKFERFCRFALDASRGGRRGDFGGSVTLSHAFDHDSMRQAYARRYGDRRVKERVSCLVWKESHRVTAFLRRQGLPPEELSRANPKLRFLMPIRNPLDCMLSNCTSGHLRYFSSTDVKNTRLAKKAEAVGPDWTTIEAPAVTGRPAAYYGLRFSDAERFIAHCWMSICGSLNVPKPARSTSFTSFRMSWRTRPSSSDWAGS